MRSHGTIDSIDKNITFIKCGFCIYNMGIRYDLRNQFNHKKTVYVNSHTGLKLEIEKFSRGRE